MYDVVIIGGGIIGCSIARALSKFKLDIILLEKATELSEGTSKANSGIIHAGYDCEPNTLKAKFNVAGNDMYSKLVEELDIPYRKNGALVVAYEGDDVGYLKKLYEKGKRNNVPGLAILNKEEVIAMEKNINPDVVGALYAPTSAIISPYEATIAFAENAYLNGVKFSLETEVSNIEKGNNNFKIFTNKGEFETKTVVNAAGLYSDDMNNFVSEKQYKIVPRKGEYMLFDRATKGFVDKTIFQLPNEYGKGVLILPTVHDNLLVGPSADDIYDKNSKTTTADVFKKVLVAARKTIKDIPLTNVITSFSGLRANILDEYDFVIDQPEDAKGFVNCIGINSPGLSAAPAIALYVTELLSESLTFLENKQFIGKRNAITVFKTLSAERQNKLIKENNSYGNIVCRCETVTEGEIIEAINRPLGATTIDGVKRRTRAGGGRCQGGFCSIKVLEILVKTLAIQPEQVTKFGGNSNIIMSNETGGGIL